MRHGDDEFETSSAGEPAGDDADQQAADGGTTIGEKIRELFGSGSLTGGSITGGTGGTGGLSTGAGDMSGGPFTGGDVMTGGDDGVDSSGAGGLSTSRDSG